MSLENETLISHDGSQLIIVATHIKNEVAYHYCSLPSCEGIMATQLLIAFALTLAAGLSTAIGGLVVLKKKQLSDRFLATSLGFSAGVMLWVSFAEIVPKATQNLSEAFGDRGEAAAVAAFFGGVLLIALIDRLVPDVVNPHEQHEAGVVDVRKLRNMGIMTAAAIVLHNIPEGIAVAIQMWQATGSRKRGFTWAALTGLAEPIGALVGFLLLLPLLGPMTLGIAFGAVAGIMVFISIDELLPTAVATGRHHAAIYGLIVGMAIMAISLLLFA